MPAASVITVCTRASSPNAPGLRMRDTATVATSAATRAATAPTSSHVAGAAMLLATCKWGRNRIADGENNGLLPMLRGMDGTTRTRVDSASTSVPRAARDDLAQLLEVCTWPSEAFWRAFELGILKHPGLIEPPVLELGCGDGGFTELLGLTIDEAIDLNPRSVRRARDRRHVYGSVREMDIRDLSRERPGTYQTLFANSVLEHVDGLEGVLPHRHEVLRPGGRLVTTVPLADMNRHLLSERPGYTRMRQAQLQHHNLWSVEEWRMRLVAAGFEAVSATRYLDPESCRFWDRVDFPAGWGFGRYRLAVAVRMVTDRALPPRVRERAKRRIVDQLAARHAAAPSHPSDGCAALVVATKAA